MGQVEKKSIHTKIIVGAGAVILVLNLINPAAIIAKKQKSETVAANSQSQSAGMFEEASNPSISWFDNFFCRGRSAATFCSNDVLHPKAEEISKREQNFPSPEDQSIGAYTFQEKNLY